MRRGAGQIFVAHVCLACFTSAVLSSSIEPWTGWRRSPDPFLWPALESQRRSASPIEETVDRDNTSGDYVAIGGQNWLRSQSFPVAFALSTIPLVILFLWVCWPALLA